MVITKYHKILYFPIKLLLSFLIITEVLIWLGPHDFHIANPYLLAFYLIIVNIALWLGYICGIRNFGSTVCHHHIISVKHLIPIALILSLITTINAFSVRGVSIDNIPTYLLFALNNPGDAYYADQLESSTNYFMLLFSPISAAAVPLGILYWKKINKAYKIMTLLIILLIMMRWLGIGSRKGIFDMGVTIFSIIIASNPKYITKSVYRNKLLIPISILGALFIAYFVFSNMSRNGLTSFNDYSLSISSYRSFYVENFSMPVIISMDNITSYLCQGYYALSKCLDMGIIAPAPLGSSWFTIAIAKKFDYDPTPDTYMAILEKQSDISMSENWHSIYVWLANDFTFIGVPLVIFLIGMLLAVVWKDSVFGKNYRAFPLLALLFLMVFYFYANNQVISFDFVPFLFWSSFYLISRNNKLINKKSVKL